MKVKNMITFKGNVVPNQFEIEDKNFIVFQSYDTIIARVSKKGLCQVELDKKSWNFSRTTAKYRNKFLRQTTKETQARIDKGIYALVDLNK